MSAAQFANQYSFALGGAMSLAVLAIWLFRDGITLNDLLAFGALAFKPGESSENSSAAVLEEIGAGTPVLLEFQSPF